MSTACPDLRRNDWRRPDLRRFAIAIAGLITGGLTAFLIG
jgi:hypothetical protein